MRTYDIVVIGAGCFGAWTAYELQRSGHRVLLLDAYGPAHSRSSSGDESRVIRMGYGRDELYTRWACRARDQWEELSARTGRTLFHEIGVLWLAGSEDTYTRDSQLSLDRARVPYEELSVDEVGRRHPQFSTERVAWALWERQGGILMARQSIQALVKAGIDQGLSYSTVAVTPPTAGTRLERLATGGGDAIAAGNFIYACGAWLPKLFPDLLGKRIFPTRQEVFYFAPPAGDPSFGQSAMPVWMHHDDLVYGMPDVDNRGVKIAVDRHGPAIDPDTGVRLATQEGLAEARANLARRFPRLADAPLAESRVCVYENTSNGDFIIDRHPEIENVLIVGGGSGHGFKHGPSVGEYVRRIIDGSGEPEPRFALAGKAVVQNRTVY